MDIRFCEVKPHYRKEYKIKGDFPVVFNYPYSLEIGKSLEGDIYLKSLRFGFGDGENFEDIAGHLFTLFEQIEREIALWNKKV